MNALTHSVSIPSIEPGPILTPVRAFLNLLRIEFRRSQGYWLLPVMVVLGIYAPSIEHLPQDVLWPEMGIAIMDSYAQIGPIGATLGAWLVTRERRRGLTGVIDSVPGWGIQRDLIAVCCAAIWGLLGYLGVACWYLGLGVLRATWGGPDWRLIGIGAAAVVALSALGVLIGRLVPGRYAPLVAFLAIFVLIIGNQVINIDRADGSTRAPGQFLLPFGGPTVFDGEVFFRRKVSLADGILPWFVALTVCLIAVIALTRRRSVIGCVAVAVSLAIAGATAAPLVTRDYDWQPEAFEYREWTPVCENRDGLEICVHPAFRNDLATTAVQISGVLTPIRGLPGVPEMWVQGDHFLIVQDVLPGSFSSTDQYSVEMEVITSLFPRGNHFPQRPASQIVILTWLWLNVNDFRANHAFEDGMLDMFGIPSEVSASEVVVEEDGAIMGGPQGDPAQMAALAPKMQAALDRFVALDPVAQRAWLEFNWTALVAGEISLDEMP